jgi:hypothetical protein
VEYEEDQSELGRPVVLYGCETWCLTPREEQRWRIFVNNGLRRIFGSKRKKMAEGWRGNA